MTQLPQRSMNFRLNSPVPDEVWSVSQLTHYIRDLFEIDFRLQDVQVSGEISNFIRARSGHLYFTLKDEGSQLKCVMWRTAAQRLRFDPQDGNSVVARGKVSVYGESGVYQLYAERLESAGIGNLALAFEQLKQKLSAEGLFDPLYKKPIPTLPHKIGIVTSPDAAALRDILNVLRRRYPLVTVLIAPTLVQGAEAPAQIIRALGWLDQRTDIDTIILARGGGSIEDLWAFNDEGVARAIFATQHPTISGIGHETDFTIADFVADLRAPTPSAAAELAVPDMEELKQTVHDLQNSLAVYMENSLQESRWQFQALSRTLRHLSPQARLAHNQQRLDSLTLRLERTFTYQQSLRRSRLAVGQAHLQAVSPLATLSRGYAIIHRSNGQIIRRVADVSAHEQLHVQLADGMFEVITLPNPNT